METIRKEFVEIENEGVYIYKYDPATQIVDHSWTFSHTNLDRNTGLVLKGIGTLLREERISLDHAIGLLDTITVKKAPANNSYETVEQNEQDYLCRDETEETYPKSNNILETMAVLSHTLQATNSINLRYKLEAKLESLLNEL